MKIQRRIITIWSAMLCTVLCAVSTNCVAQLTATLAPGIPDIPDQTIFYGSTPANIILKGYTGSVTKWQWATESNFSQPTDIADTSHVLTGKTIGPLTSNTYFRAVLQSDSSFQTSQAVAIKIEPLPAKLSFFNQQCDGRNVLLQWATSAELNNHHFIVERSTDAVSWYSIKTIAGSAKSNSNIDYSFTDSTAKGRNNFYRLKQVDIKGNSILSDVINSYCGNLQANFTISPNPGVDLFLISNLPANGMLRITDNKGRAVWPIKVYGGSTYSVNLGNFARGIYYVTVYIDGQTLTKQFIKE